MEFPHLNFAGPDMPISSEALPDGTFIVRRYVDSDNSCLFTAVAYALEHNRSKGYNLRQIIAAAVGNDPDVYNEGVLGRSVTEYQQWILHPRHWGGEIELAILSLYYQKQIAAFDVQTAKCRIYGLQHGFKERGMLIYDGLHYDALAVAQYDGAPEEMDVTVFDPESTEGRIIMEGATALVIESLLCAAVISIVAPHQCFSCRRFSRISMQTDTSCRFFGGSRFVFV